MADVAGVPVDAEVAARIAHSIGPAFEGFAAIAGTLRRRGVGFKSLHEALDTTTPGGRLVFHVFAALAEFIRELIVEGTRAGLTPPAPAARASADPRP